MVSTLTSKHGLALMAGAAFVALYASAQVAKTTDTGSIWYKIGSWAGLKA